MNMTVAEALDILGIEDSPVTKEMVKINHRRLLSKFHPDRNPDGHETTQMINIARDFLYGQSDPIRIEYKHTYRSSYDPSVIHVRGMTVIKGNGITIVEGDTFKFKEVLKECRFRWDPDDRHWWREGNFSIELYLQDAYVY